MPGVKRAPLAIVGGLLVLAALVPLTGGQLGSPGASSRPTEGPGSTTGASGTSQPPGTGGGGEASPPSSAGPSATDTPATPLPQVQAAIVPVTQFRTTRTGTDLDAVKAVLDGSSTRYDGLELVEGDADAILAALGLDGTEAAADRLIVAPDAATLTKDLAKHRKRLAFLRADEITPAVRALTWDGTALFGTKRVRDLADWPLTATVDAPPDGTVAFDPAATWTMVAGGDILLDRGVALTLKSKGAGYAFDGGTVDITGRCKDCSAFGWDLPYTKRTGNKGAVRDLIEGADIAAANFENPAPDRPRFHASGTSFSADPRLIDGLADAGIDYVSLANNHIRDAGAAGLLQTVKNVTKRGIKVSGAGKDLKAARKPAMLEAAGTKVAILGYDAIAKGYHATANRAGSAGLSAKAVKADVAAARKAGADVVVVYPHWGTEYDPTPFSNQKKLAEMIIDAGADMVIGNHAHWAGAMEVYKGKPIWYALGNFVFDQTWSEPTMEGITLELTFNGGTLVQARMRPHLILDKAQPNFLDPAGDGKVVMGQVFDASKGLLPW